MRIKYYVSGSTRNKKYTTSGRERPLWLSGAPVIPCLIRNPYK